MLAEIEAGAQARTGLFDRQRRVQKRLGEMLPVRSDSRSSNVVMS